MSNEPDTSDKWRRIESIQKKLKKGAIWSSAVECLSGLLKNGKPLSDGQKNLLDAFQDYPGIQAEAFDVLFALRIFHNTGAFSSLAETAIQSAERKIAEKEARKEKRKK